MATSNRVKLALHYGILAVMGALFISPLLWMAFASVDTHAVQLLRLPQEPTLEHFIHLLSDAGIMRSFVNGFMISGGQATLVVLVCMLAAYPLSRFKIRGKRGIMLGVLFLTSLPMTAVIVPVFQLFLRLRLLDNLFWVMIFLTAAALPFGIWMTKNFMDSVPVELEEAVWIDGGSVLTGLRVVVAPLMLPGILTVAIFTFTGSWGNFLVPFMLIHTQESLPSSVTIFQFFGQFGVVNFGRLAAFSVLQTLPVLVLYGLSQAFMSKGFSMGGASKG